MRGHWMGAERSIDPVRGLQSMQRRAREIAPVGAEVPDRQPIRSDVNLVRSDGHRRGKVGLLPARSSLPCKRYRSEESAVGAPEAAHMCAGVGRALVKAYAGDG